MIKNAKIKDLLKAFARILQSLLTVSYLGAYRYYTLKPIEKIERCQGDISRRKLIEALVDFRRTKDEELSFVAKAVGQDLLHPVGGNLSYTTCPSRLPYRQQRSSVSSHGRPRRRQCGRLKCSGTGVFSCRPSRSSARLPHACSSTYPLKPARTTRSPEFGKP